MIVQRGGLEHLAKFWMRASPKAKSSAQKTKLAGKHWSASFTVMDYPFAMRESAVGSMTVGLALLGVMIGAPASIRFMTAVNLMIGSDFKCRPLAAALLGPLSAHSNIKPSHGRVQLKRAQPGVSPQRALIRYAGKSSSVAKRERVRGDDPRAKQIVDMLLGPKSRLAGLAECRIT